MFLVIISTCDKGESWGIELCGEGPTEVRKIRPGGPADQAGLQTGDTILQCGGINVTRFGHQQVATIIAETDRLLRMKVLPDEGSSDESEEDDKDEDPTLKIKDKKFKSGEWWCDPENEKKLQEEKEKNKIDPYDFESFSENFDKIEKQHRKAGKNMVKNGRAKGTSKKVVYILEIYPFLYINFKNYFLLFLPIKFNRSLILTKIPTTSTQNS